MTITLLLLLAALALAGFVIGRWMRRSARPMRWRGLALLLAVPAAPFACLLLANVLHSDTLGWVAGLSLMFIVPLGIPLLLGAVLGWLVGAGQPRDESVPHAPLPPPPPAAPAAPLPWDRILPGVQVMLGVGAGFWVVLALGFRLHDQQAPAPLDGGLWPAVLVLVLVLARGARVVAGWVARRHAPPPASGAWRLYDEQVSGSSGQASDRDASHR